MTSLSTPHGTDKQDDFEAAKKDRRAPVKQKNLVFQQEARSTETILTGRLEQILTDYRKGRINKQQANDSAFEALTDNDNRTRKIALTRLKSKTGADLPELPKEMQTQQYNRTQQRLSEFRRIVDDTPMG